MITYKDKVYTFQEIKDKIERNDIEDEKEFIIEAMRSCFFTEDGTTIVDEHGVTVMTNEAHKKIMGIDGKDIVGKHVEALVDEGVFQESASLKAFRSGKQEVITQTLKNGKVVLVTSTPICDDEGNVERIINNVRDIPMLEQLYEERNKQEALLDDYRNRIFGPEYMNKNNVVAASASMRKVLNLAERAANSDSSVLILGDSGTGKTVVAELIHKMSSRREQPMVSINCGAIPENLLESELFGYVGGAFTGANKNGKVGLFEVANGGVVFLDEIGELPINLQPKLLSFLESGEFMRVGSTKILKVDCRVIAATNRNLKQMIEENLFREDLYYRLSVIPINIPPLRDRKEDIAPLVAVMLKEINEKNGTNKTISKKAMNMLERREWRGNVRELRNVIERCVVLSTDDEVTEEFIPEKTGDVSVIQVDSADELPVNLKEVLNGVEDKYIEMALKEGGTIRKAAGLLGLSPTTLFRKINRSE
ncbi:MAG: sigma 54-interacting transcriptional regulator [Firmicutes bacterium]|nr:sigma 54-interacting transcriptional regulator [Bacillota bacterium]